MNEEQKLFYIKTQTLLKDIEESWTYFNSKLDIISEGYTYTSFIIEYFYTKIKNIYSSTKEIDQKLFAKKEQMLLYHLDIATDDEQIFYNDYHHPNNQIITMSVLNYITKFSNIIEENIYIVNLETSDGEKINIDLINGDCIKNLFSNIYKEIKELRNDKDELIKKVNVLRDDINDLKNISDINIMSESINKIKDGLIELLPSPIGSIIKIAGGVKNIYNLKKINYQLETLKK